MAKGDVVYARCPACGERDQWTRPGQWAADRPRCGFCGAGLVRQDADPEPVEDSPAPLARRPVVVGGGRKPGRRVVCDVEEVELDGDYGRPVPGVCARCTRCGHETESFGTSDRSVRRCLVVMREECPEGGANYYVEDSGEG